MTLLKGRRKFTAFMITIGLYTISVLYATSTFSGQSIDMPAYVFQLAAAYGVLSALFFGSNVLEHFAARSGEPFTGNQSKPSNPDLR